MSTPSCLPEEGLDKLTSEAIARFGIRELDTTDRHWNLGTVGSEHLENVRSCLRVLLARLTATTAERDTHKANAQTLDIELRDTRAEVRRLEGLAAQRKLDSEELADRLHQEQLAHAQVRQALVDVTRELERLPQVEKVARAVLRVCDAPTTIETTESRALELVGVLAVLRAVLQGEEVPALIKETLANLGTSSVLTPAGACTAAHSIEPEMPGLPGWEGDAP